MKAQLKHILSAGLLLVLSLPVWALDAGWELAKDSKGIQVYLREVPNSPVKAFRGEVEIDAGVLQILGALDDTPAFTEWMHNCAKSELIHKYSLVDRQQYMVIDFPWPTTDRDMIIRNKISYDLEQGYARIDLSAFDEAELPAEAKAKMPGKSKFRRVSELTGFFELQQLSPEKTRVVYQLHMDPAGSVPSGIVNMMLVDNPFNSLQGLRERAPLAKYQDFDPLNVKAELSVN
ncbi:START domain-containing protein [Spongiibacter sp. KMU-158]|uniref:START domain-containing protein n=1 Tax=Spongiibacter pelagi TaxID=2760804 RepID=A0A927C321_9GAMM|nr:START domain-containing protein [Spongiibacter pelagi]MBD2858565.1 START domain-containing protein [Spongiibacter pelagi]